MARRWSVLLRSSALIALAAAAGVPMAGVGTARPASPLTSCTVPVLSGFNIPAVTILSATNVAASGLDPEYCEVIGSVATHGERAGPGDARFQLKLPATWNNKYLATGPGGVSGNLFPLMSPVDLAASIRKGYAWVTTDTGHQSGFFDASWALLAPGVPNEAAVADYFYRAQHQVALATKALVTTFYDGPIERAYFDGCSNAGRNGLMEAMRFPDDYDGIIVGAPAMDLGGAAIAGYKNSKAFLNAFIPPDKLPAIDQAVIADCDGADGVVDGLIQNPGRCSFDPNTLVPGTLTQAQADALTIFIRAVRDDRDRIVYPGSPVSDLSDAGGFGGFVPWAELGAPVNVAAAQPWGAAAPIDWQIADTILRYMVIRDPAFNSNLDWPETDGVITRDAVRLVDKRMEAGRTDRPEALVPYLRRGKKVLMYFGYADQALTPYRTIWFYQDLAEIFGGYHSVQQHARLFMVPGMQHCIGGPGPNSFDTLTALENWVERGIAPEGIVATKYVNDDPSQGVARTMPLCKFPEQARYDGVGDVRDAASWSCSARDRSLLRVGRNGIEAGLRARNRDPHGTGTR